MRDIFNVCSALTFREYIDARMKEYEKDGYYFKNRQAYYDYLCLIMHYLYKTRPLSEHTMDSVMKLLGASVRIEGYRTPFWQIIRSTNEIYPTDDEFYRGRKLEDVIGNGELDEIFSFFEYEFMKEPDEDKREALLGRLAVSRGWSYKNKIGNVRMNRSIAKENTKRRQDPFGKEVYEEFLKKYTPQKIKEYLDRYVIGQDETKILLATAVYNHYLRLAYPEEKLLKTNVLMIGPSGCGKTELIRRLKEIVQVPVVITDFSGVVATPWKGRNKEEALLNLYIKAGKDLGKAERGIVFCDEFDKAIRNRSNSREDINMELQGQLLGMMEGTNLDVPYERPDSGRVTIHMNTENILFICAGAFEGLDKIAMKDQIQKGIGFGSAIDMEKEFELTGKNLKIDYLVEYGMKQELAGRLGGITVLKKLDREALRQVLVEVEDSIFSKSKNEFQIEDDVQLTFTDDAVDIIIDRVMQMDIGARGLNSVVHDILAKPLYEVPSLEGVREVVITGRSILDNEPCYR